MATKTMIISPSHPLSARRVHLDDGREFALDEAGQFHAELLAGTHDIELLVDGRWQSHKITIEDPHSMQIIDIDNDTTSTGLVGKILDERYRIDDVIAQGGMGIVYRAVDERLERTVAIKTLARRVRHDRQVEELFLERASKMTTLSHPHLAVVHEATTYDGVAAMICEYVEGKNLKYWMDVDGPLAVDDALVIGYQMSTAVAFLHQREIVHGDIEPASAIIDKQGGIKLVDFGLARRLQDAAAKGTRVPRTPAYMAPEQIHEALSTQASDVFRLAVILFELLTAELPADRDRPTKLEAFERDNLVNYAEAPRRSISSLRQDLPEALSTLVDLCLGEDPQKRPSAREVSDRLAALYQERSGELPPEQVSPNAFTAGKEVEKVEKVQKQEPAASRERPIKPAVSDIDPGRGVAPPPGDVEDDDGELVRPVRRIALFVFIIGTLFAVAVLAHFLLADTPEPSPPPEPEVTEPGDDR